MLLIEPVAAGAYEEAHRPEVDVEDPDSLTLISSGAGPGGPTAVKVVTTGGGIKPARPRSFHGAAEVPAATAKMRLVQIAEEVINLLCSDPNATVRVTLEISAEFPDGASDQTRRAVSENGTNLGFKISDWD